MERQMSTSEEKQELIEKLKGPRYYRIQLWGYGGEAEYMELTKEQYEFWHAHIDEHGDSDAVHYCVSAEDGEFDFDNLQELPEEMQFLKVPGEDYSGSWYESPTGFTHQWGVDYNNANITVEEVSGNEYSANHIADVVDGEELSDYINKLEEENNYELELTEMGVDEGEDNQPDYIGQMWSSEKGTFFEGYIETHGDFDPKKLKIYTSEYLNGDDTVQSIEYDGQEVDNHGGDTNGKGYSFHVWKTVE
jgi:hypothetical protein